MKKILSIVALGVSSITANAQSVEQGLKYVDNERYSSAKAEFKAVINKDSKNGDAYFYLGEIYLKHNQKDSARICFDQGVLNAPKNPLNLVGQGTLDYIAGQKDVAKLKFDQATALGKKNAVMYYKIASAYAIYEPKNYAEAIPLLKDKALVYDRTLIDAHLLLGDIYLWQNDGTNAALNYNNALNVNPNSAKAQIRKGQIYVITRTSTGYTEALNLYLKGIQNDSTFSPAYRELGELYQKVQRYKEAIDAYEKYMSRSDKNDETNLMYGKFLFLAKNFLKAKDVLLDLQPRVKDPVVSRLLGYCYFETGDYAQANNYIANFIETQPSDKLLSSDFEYNAKSLQKLKKDSLAIINFNKAITLDTSKFMLNADIAAIYRDQNKFKEASDYYKKIADRKPNSINDVLNYARTLYFANLTTEADTVIGQFIVKWPTSPYGYLWKARVKRKIDAGDKLWLAKPYYEKCIELSTDVSKNKKDVIESYQYLASFHMKTDKVKSLELWNKVKELDPTNKTAEGAIKQLSEKK